jgi:uncharacterized protein
MTMRAIAWRHLHQHGQDACRVLEQADGWLIEGMAAFVQDTQPAALAYRVRCDGHWLTREASVQGWIGRQLVALDIRHQASRCWTINGEPQPVDKEVVDLDLGFTPATNLIAIRRLAIGIGETVPAPAAYLELPATTLRTLEQTYRRVDARRLAYASPGHDYEAELITTPEGLVVLYPGLFEACGQAGERS